MSLHFAFDLLSNNHVVAIINEGVLVMRKTTANFLAETLKTLGPFKDRKFRPSLSNLFTSMHSL